MRSNDPAHAHAAKHRLFFALWPSDALRDQIAHTVGPLIEGRRARKIRAANFHITLAFLGSVSDDRFEDVVKAGNEVSAAPFDLTIDHLESWRAAHVACLTIASIPPPLAALVERLRCNLLARAVEADQKEFRAHVTVARDWRDQRLDERIGPLVWRIREFVLVESQLGSAGSEYRIVRTWPLAENSNG